MQFKLATFTTLFAAATLVAATATPMKRLDVPEDPMDQCLIGELLCCNSVQRADSDLATVMLGLVGAVVDDITVPVGVTCSPVQAIGAGGTSCTAQPTCCTDNSFNGIVAIGCSPVNINV